LDALSSLEGLNLSIGYAGVAEMIAIDGSLPMNHPIKQQEKKLKHLKEMDEEFQGPTQGCLECRDCGAQQIAGLQEIAGSKRASSESFNIQPPKFPRIHKLLRNRRRKIRASTDKSISAY
jgi:hypothetical protein